jgi:hypothetical protein
MRSQPLLEQQRHSEWYRLLNWICRLLRIRGSDIVFHWKGQLSSCYPSTAAKHHSLMMLVFAISVDPPCT